jgi:pyrroline-5-carboxylate reductase
MKISECHLGFIGFGHMAQVICQAIAQSRLIPLNQILFTRRDPQKAKRNEQEFKITATSLENLVKRSQILILAVRPNQAEGVLKELAPLLVEPKLLLTVVSGMKQEKYEKILGPKAIVLRTMPNVASAVGEGMTLFAPTSNTPREYLELGHLLFGAMGEVIDIPESKMDSGTVIAGCGPGFVFRLIHAFATYGEKEGISYEDALKMAAQAFAGGARLILKGGKPETLLEQIATPNGLTEAGLKEMTALHIDQQVHTFLEAATKRSKEIAS